jgi:hypothetical protein
VAGNLNPRCGISRQCIPFRVDVGYIAGNA